MKIGIFKSSFWQFLAVIAFFCPILAIKNLEIARNMFQDLPPLQRIIVHDENLYSLATNHRHILKQFPSCLDTALIEGNILCQKALKPNVSFKDFSQLLSDATNMLQKQHEMALLSPKKGQRKMNFFEKAFFFNSEAVLHVIGDQHGSFHDTVNFIGSIFYSGEQHDISPFQESTFTLKPEYRNHHWIFCGDLADGGIYGTETLALLLSVFIQNPDNIHIIRGNHEDIQINRSYGFYKELELKYEKCANQLNLTCLQYCLQSFYESLPVALWGIFAVEAENSSGQKGSSEKYNVFLFCHGGIEKQDQGILDLCRNCMKSKHKVAYKHVHGVFHDAGDVGYLWNDINPDAKEKRTRQSSRGPNCFVLSQHDIAQYMKNEFGGSEFVFRHIFRAHQHTTAMVDLMPIFFKNHGICQLGNPENPAVTTLLVMPGTFAGIPRQSEYASFPGVVQAVPVVLYQKESLKNVHYEFVALPNNHIPDVIFQKHNRILAHFDKSIAPSVKQERPRTLLRRTFAGPRWY